VLVQGQGDLRILGRVGRRLLEADLVEGDLLGALAGDVLEVRGLRPRYLRARLSMSCRVAVESST
jgi:hypothetical protein